MQSCTAGYFKLKTKKNAVPDGEVLSMEGHRDITVNAKATG